MNNTALITTFIINNNIYMSVDLGFIYGVTGFIRIIIVDIHVIICIQCNIIYYKHLARISFKHELAFRKRHCTRYTYTRSFQKTPLPPPPFETTSTITITDYTGNANLIYDRHSIRVVDIFCTSVAILFVVFVVSRNVVGNIVILLLRENVIYLGTIECEMLSFYIILLQPTRNT